MRTWIERVSLRDGFAGRYGPGGEGEPTLDRIKAMKREGWKLSVWPLPSSDEAVVFGWRP